MEVVKRVERMIQHSCISFGVLIAQEIGILDVLREADGPLTSHQVADTKKLKERYVREILGCLTSACLVQISSNNEGEPTYFFHDDFKKEIDANFFRNLLQVKMLMSQYHSTKACIPLDGPNGKFYNSELHDWLDELNRHTKNDFRINSILEKVHGLQDKLEQGINVIEFGSGSGHLLSKFATKFPKSEFTVSEIHDSIVDEMKSRWGKIPNMHFEKYDICQMKEFPSKKFDLVLTVLVVHDLPHPLVAMESMRKVTNEEGGLCVLLDMAGPSTHAGCVGMDTMAVNFSFSTFLCIPESFQVEDSEAYGACWGTDTAVSLLKKSGFDVNCTMLSEDVALYICGYGKEVE